MWNVLERTSMGNAQERRDDMPASSEENHHQGRRYFLSFPLTAFRSLHEPQLKGSIKPYHSHGLNLNRTPAYRFPIGHSIGIHVHMMIFRRFFFRS